MRGTIYELAGGEYGVSTPYSAEVVRAMHSLPGPRWDKARRLWVVTPDAATPLRGVLERLGLELGVHAPWPPQPPPAPLNGDVPQALPLRGYQREAVGFALAAEGQSALISLDMGLGKGLVAIAHGLRVGGPRLILYPGIIRSVWGGTATAPGEVVKWLPGADVRVLRTRTAEPLLLAGLDEDSWILANYEILDYHEVGRDEKGEPILEPSGWLEPLRAVRPRFRLIVADECHHIKRWRGARSAQSKRAKRSRAVRDLCQAHPGAARLGLTGTPILSKPGDLWGQLDWVHPGSRRWGGYWDFVRRYTDAHEGDFGWVVEGVKHADELQERLRWVAYRRTKAEVTDLPPKVRQVITIEAAEAARAVETATAEVWAATGKRPTRQQVLGVLHGQGGVKWPALADLLEGLSSRAVVFTYRRDTAEMLERRIVDHCKGYLVRRLDRESSAGARDRVLDEFRSAPPPAVLVATIGIAGVGIDLSAADVAIFVDLDYVPAYLLQAEDRLYRPPQTRSVTVYYIALQNSLDEAVARTVAAKLDQIQAVLGEDAAAAGLKRAVDTVTGVADEQAALDALSALLAERVSR